MLAPPDDLPDDVLVSTLAREWRVTVASMVYRPVGFGSHHWETVDDGGTRWFVTADDLATRRRSLDEPVDAAFGRLRAAFTAARALADGGRTFVVAPVPTVAGEPVARANERFSVAVHPFVDGESYSWGEFATPEHRRAALDLVTAVHTAPVEVRRHAGVDDFEVPHRDELEAALDPAGPVDERGPYARPASELLAGNAAPIRWLLARYDELVAEGRAAPSRLVLTHGEPHRGNTLRTADGWLLIDWDTALVAPPERDLWHLDPGDGSMLAAYAEATGVRPLPAMVELYRLRWDLADLAMGASRFRGPHTGNADDEEEWGILRRLVAHLAG